MKWSHRIQIVTGQTCIHISLHLLLASILVWGWRHQALMQVSMVLLVLYCGVFIVMMLAQRISRLRNLGDFLEDVSTTYYFGAAMLVLLLLSQLINNHLLLGGIGLLMLAGPAALSLLAREPQAHASEKRRH